jgi:hypothetical protein
MATGAGAETWSVLCRVRSLLADVRDASLPRGSSDASERLAEARRSGTARMDLGEVRDRLARLRSAHPEIHVETGPLVGLAGEHIDRLARSDGFPVAAASRGAAS